MKTKENKIKITLKTIIYSVFAFFTILYIVMFFNMYFPINKAYAKETTTNLKNENTSNGQKISNADQIDVEKIINENTNNGQTEQITKVLEINLISDDVSIKVVKDGETGLLHQVEDVEDMTAKIQPLLESRMRIIQLSRNSVSYVSQFSFAKYAAAFCNLYERIN